MKKALLALLTLLLCFSLFACGPKDEQNDGGNNGPQIPSTPGFDEPIDTPIVEIPLG